MELLDPEKLHAALRGELAGFVLMHFPQPPQDVVSVLCRLLVVRPVVQYFAASAAFPSEVCFVSFLFSSQNMYCSGVVLSTRIAEKAGFSKSSSDNSKSKRENEINTSIFLHSSSETKSGQQASQNSRIRRIDRVETRERFL